jgi:hypothetical protein
MQIKTDPSIYHTKPSKFSTLCFWLTNNLRDTLAVIDFIKRIQLQKVEKVVLKKAMQNKLVIKGK